MYDFLTQITNFVRTVITITFGCENKYFQYISFILGLLYDIMNEDNEGLPA